MTSARVKMGGEEENRAGYLPNQSGAPQVVLV